MSFAMSLSAGLCHQPSVFKIHASVNVHLSPVAIRSARGEALCQPVIGKALEGAVYPPETESRFNNFNEWNSWPLRWTLTAISHYPTTFLFAMVLFDPLPKFGAIPKVEKINYFHRAISIRLY